MEHQNDFTELYGTDEFRMYCFKILPCSKRVPHNWQQCAFAHWGEKARRRDLRIHSYTSQLCPDAKRESGCQRGDACQMSHNIFEAWLHPELYRTQLCTAGSSCNRTVCFFAHSQAELRQPSQPSRQVPQTSNPNTTVVPQEHQDNVLLCSSNAAAAHGVSTVPTVPSMFWTDNNSSNGMLPLTSWDSPVQQQLTFGGFDALEYIPAASNACMLGDSSVYSLCLGGTGSSISGWSSKSNSIACGSPSASAPNHLSVGCNPLGDRLAAAAKVLPAAAYRSSSGSSISVMSGGADLALALQQLKFVPDTPAAVVSGPAPPSALTADMTFSNSYNTGFPAQQLCDSNGSTVGLAGNLHLLLPSAAAAAASSLLLQQQREHLQKQQLLLAQEQMLLQQQLQVMNLGLGGQPMVLIPS